MDIDNIPAWAEKNVGRKVKWLTSITKKEKVGRIVGYHMTLNKIIVDGHIGHATSKNNKWLLPDIDTTAWVYGWVLPQEIVEFVDPEPVRATTSHVKKVISEYPHECPRCGGPAYVGFMTTVDCRRKCP